MTAEGREAYWREYAANQRQLREERSAAWFKEHGPCVDCGSWERLGVYDSNRRSIGDGRVWLWAEPRRLAALETAVVRCWPCQRSKKDSKNEEDGWETISIGQSPVWESADVEHTHDGPPSRAHYQRDNCRHPACKVENAKYHRRYRGGSSQ